MVSTSSARCAARPAGGHLQAVDFPDALLRFDTALELSGHAAKTRHAYRRALTNFWCDFAYGRVDPIRATSLDVADYLRSLTAQGHPRGDALRALKAWFSWAIESGMRDADPTALMRVPRYKVRPAPDLPDAQITALLRAAFRREDRRGWAMLLCYTTGARVGSLVAVRWADVDLDRGTIWFRCAKNDRPYSLPLSRKATLAVRHLLAEGHDPLVGVGAAQFRNWVHAAEQDAGLDRVWPHRLRHAYSRRVAAGGDPELWRKAMNHADLSQWARYNDGDAERVRAVLEAV